MALIDLDSVEAAALVDPEGKWMNRGVRRVEKASALTAQPPERSVFRDESIALAS